MSSFCHADVNESFFLFSCDQSFTQNVIFIHSVHKAVRCYLPTQLQAYHGNHVEFPFFRLLVVLASLSLPNLRSAFQHGHRHCTLAFFSSDTILVPTVHGLFVAVKGEGIQSLQGYS